MISQAIGCTSRYPALLLKVTSLLFILVSHSIHIILICEELTFHCPVVRSFPLICTAALNHDGRDGNGPPRAHTCISHKVYSLFGLDGLIGNPDYDGDTSGEDEDTPAASSSRVVATLASIAAAPIAAASTAAASTATTVSTPAGSLTSNIHLPLSSASSYSFLPARIWNAPWVTTVGRYHGLFSPELLSECVYDIATDNAIPEKLEIRGKDVAELVTLFKELLAQAAAQGDFTNILSSDRSFLM